MPQLKKQCIIYVKGASHRPKIPAFFFSRKLPMANETASTLFAEKEETLASSKLLKIAYWESLFRLVSNLKFLECPVEWFAFLKY